MERFIFPHNQLLRYFFIKDFKSFFVPSNSFFSDSQKLITKLIFKIIPKIKTNICRSILGVTPDVAGPGKFFGKIPFQFFGGLA